MNKKTILILIDNLTRGGAETLLVGMLPELSAAYNIILVTLSDRCEFSQSELVYHKKYSLGFRNKLSYVACLLRLRKIILKYKPGLVHAHLLNSSIIARISCPRKIPLLYSIHSMLSLNAFNNSRTYRTLEKYLFDQRHYVIAVSSEVLKDYEKCIGTTSKNFILKNYIADTFLLNQRPLKDFSTTEVIKMVAVGNIKRVKNYEYLLNALIELKGLSVSLDIYGKGEDKYVDQLQQFIIDHDLPVSFKGSCDSIHRVLPMYDLFVMSSNNEGFGMAAAEAMATGIPTLLSDIPVLKEVTMGNALFFDLKDTSSFASLVKEIATGKYDLDKLAANGKLVVKENYSKSGYFRKLQSVYNQILNNDGRGEEG
jgi:glycosyltransferase involved in cell wall biosynthesis